MSLRCRSPDLLAEALTATALSAVLRPEEADPRDLIGVLAV